MADGNPVSPDAGKPTEGKKFFMNPLSPPIEKHLGADGSTGSQNDNFVKNLTGREDEWTRKWNTAFSKLPPTEGVDTSKEVKPAEGETEISLLKKQIETLQLEKKALQDENDFLKEENGKLRKDIEALQLNNQDLRKQVRTMEERLAKLEAMSKPGAGEPITRKPTILNEPETEYSGRQTTAAETGKETSPIPIDREKLKQEIIAEITPELEKTVMKGIVGLIAERLGIKNFDPNKPLGDLINDFVNEIKKKALGQPTATETAPAAEVVSVVGSDDGGPEDLGRSGWVDGFGGKGKGNEDVPLAKPVYPNAGKTGEPVKAPEKKPLEENKAVDANWVLKERRSALANEDWLRTEGANQPPNRDNMLTPVENLDKNVAILKAKTMEEINAIKGAKLTTPIAETPTTETGTEKKKSLAEIDKEVNDEIAKLKENGELKKNGELNKSKLTFDEYAKRYELIRDKCLRGLGYTAQTKEVNLGFVKLPGLVGKIIVLDEATKEIKGKFDNFVESRAGMRRAWADSMDINKLELIDFLRNKLEGKPAAEVVSAQPPTPPGQEVKPIPEDGTGPKNGGTGETPKHQGPGDGTQKVEVPNTTEPKPPVVLQASAAVPEKQSFLKRLFKKRPKPLGEKPSDKKPWEWTPERDRWAPIPEVSLLEQLRRRKAGQVVEPSTQQGESVIVPVKTAEPGGAGGPNAGGHGAGGEGSGKGGPETGGPGTGGEKAAGQSTVPAKPGGEDTASAEAQDMNEILKKINNGAFLTPAENQMMANTVADKIQAGKPLTPEELQFMANEGKKVEDLLQERKKQQDEMLNAKVTGGTSEPGGGDTATREALKTTVPATGEQQPSVLPGTEIPTEAPKPPPVDATDINKALAEERETLLKELVGENEVERHKVSLEASRRRMEQRESKEMGHFSPVEENVKKENAILRQMIQEKQGGIQKQPAPEVFKEKTYEELMAGRKIEDIKTPGGMNLDELKRIKEAFLRENFTEDKRASVLEEANTIALAKAREKLQNIPPWQWEKLGLEALQKVHANEKDPKTIQERRDRDHFKSLSFAIDTSQAKDGTPLILPRDKKENTYLGNERYRGKEKMLGFISYAAARRYLEAKRKFESYLESSGGGSFETGRDDDGDRLIYLIDKDGKYLDANPSNGEPFGFYNFDNAQKELEERRGLINYLESSHGFFDIRKNSKGRRLIFLRDKNGEHINVTPDGKEHGFFSFADATEYLKKQEGQAQTATPAAVPETAPRQTSEKTPEEKEEEAKKYFESEKYDITTKKNRKGELQKYLRDKKGQYLGNEGWKTWLNGPWGFSTLSEAREYQDQKQAFKKYVADKSLGVSFKIIEGISGDRLISLRDKKGKDFKIGPLDKYHHNFFNFNDVIEFLEKHQSAPGVAPRPKGFLTGGKEAEKKTEQPAKVEATVIPGTESNDLRSVRLEINGVDSGIIWKQFTKNGTPEEGEFYFDKIENARKLEVPKGAILMISSSTKGSLTITGGENASIDVSALKEFKDQNYSNIVLYTDKNKSWQELAGYANKEEGAARIRNFSLEITSAQAVTYYSSVEEAFTRFKEILKPADTAQAVVPPTGADNPVESSSSTEIKKEAESKEKLSLEEQLLALFREGEQPKLTEQKPEISAEDKKRLEEFDGLFGPSDDKPSTESDQGNNSNKP